MTQSGRGDVGQRHPDESPLEEARVRKLESRGSQHEAIPHQHVDVHRARCEALPAQPDAPQGRLDGEACGQEGVGRERGLRAEDHIQIVRLRLGGHRAGLVNRRADDLIQARACQPSNGLCEGFFARAEVRSKAEVNGGRGAAGARREAVGRA